ncbi:hypothetical protein pb186bvf_011684 [Paramecium bursaria]
MQNYQSSLCFHHCDKDYMRLLFSEPIIIRSFNKFIKQFSLKFYIDARITEIIAADP